MSSTRADRPRTLDPFLGAVLADRYRIERLIGRGGMGLVYLATDTTEAREVVVKLLAPHWLDDSTAVTRFEREGKRLQQLAHPNVVQLFECGHDRGQGYIAMEYLDGEPLRRFLKRNGPLTLQAFTPLAAQILAAVGYAHDRNIMLRDIKPANIMLCEREGKANFVKLLDFGLAKLVDGDDDEVTKSHVIGTAGYLAPEQIKGDPIDVRVDVYAIGVLFYYMLAGQSPIHGENDGALLYNHVHGAPTPLGTVLPEGHNVPEALVALVHQCLEKDPARRPADANEVIEALFECVPPKLFALPLANADSRKALDDYRASRDRGIEDGGPQSSEWTKPVVRPAGVGSAAEASSAALPKPPRRPSAPAAGSGAAPARRPTPAALRPRRASVPAMPAAEAPSAKAAPAGAVPPVRMPRPRGEGVPLPVATRTERSEPTEVDAPGATQPVMRTPPGDAPANGTATITPIPVFDADSARLGEIGSGPLPLGGELPVRRRYLVVAGALSLVLGGMLAWVMFGPKPTVEVVKTTAAAAATPSSGAVPSPGDAASTSRVQAPQAGESPAAPPGDDEPTLVPADAAPMGDVEIRGPEGARIEIDGVDAGAAPLRKPLSVGRHELRVVAPGHAPWTSSIDVVAGDNPAVEARLRPYKKRPGKGGGAVDDGPDEPEPPSTPLPDKPPPVQPRAPVEPPKPPPPPPPPPEPTQGPFLPTSPAGAP